MSHTTQIWDTCELNHRAALGAVRKGGGRLDFESSSKLSFFPLERRRRRAQVSQYGTTLDLTYHYISASALGVL
jgi:hypothetical protein